MEFLEAVDNVQMKKEIPPRGSVGKMVWGIKRFMSMHESLTLAVNFLDKYHFTLGDDRFYELMVHAMPTGKYRTKGIKKDAPGVICLAPGTDLEKRVCQFFGVEPRRDLWVLLEVLKRQGVGLDELKAFFGLNEKGAVKVVSSPRHDTRKGAGRPNQEKVRVTRGFEGVQRR